MNEQNTLLAEIEQQIRDGDILTGVKNLDRLLALQGQVEDEALQQAYARSIIFLVSENPAGVVLDDLHERLRKTPAYAQDGQLVSEHGEALLEAASKTPDDQTARKYAGEIQSLRGYGASETLQGVHAEALLKASEKHGARVFELAGSVSEIPIFRDSPEIQFVAARMLCNSTGQATSVKELDRAIEGLENLPLLASDSRLQESLDKARRNRERFLELRPQAAGFKHWKQLAGGGGVLGVLLVGGILLSGPSDPKVVATASASPSPAQTETYSIERDELEKYLNKSTEAYSKRNFDDAGLYAGMALKRAETLKDGKSLSQCYDLLASSYLYKGEKAQLELLDKIPESELQAYAESHMEAAQRSDDGNQVDAVKIELTVVLYLAQRAGGGKLDPTLEKAYTLCEKRKLAGLGGLAQLQLGHLEKAAELAEQSNDLELAEKILARAAASEQLGSNPGSKEATAKAHTILAKSSYLQEDFKGALEHAQTAYQEAPNEDRKERLAAYKFKDASIVTLDELNVDTFEFPPAQSSSETYTYFYTLSKAYKGPREVLLQPPNDEFHTTVAYGQPEEGIAVMAVAYTGGGFLAAFDADRQRALAPGLYEDATQFPYNNNNPGMEFSEDGSAYGRKRGKFKVHEIKYRGDELAALAIDFIYDRDSNSKNPHPVFGKIRFNSHFK